MQKQTSTRTESILFFCSTMTIRLLFLLFMTGHVIAREAPDVDCLVVHLQNVHCSWNKQEVNYTFYSRFHYESFKECPMYVSENNTRTGCIQPYENSYSRFHTFYTKLEDGLTSFLKEHELKNKVKLNPPANLTVKLGPDSNLWYYWNQTSIICAEHEVRYRINNREWDVSKVVPGSFCINLPSTSSLYELQVRSKLGDTCGKSDFWSDWSEPVVWGSNNSTDTNDMKQSMPWWAPILYASGAFAFILFVVMLRHHERVRIILLPVVPKPSITHYNVQDWLQLSKGLKETLNPNYNERACTVREYCPVSQTDRKTSSSSSSSVATDQTDYSALNLADESDLSGSCSSSAVQESQNEAEQVSV